MKQPSRLETCPVASFQPTPAARAGIGVSAAHRPAAAAAAALALALAAGWAPLTADAAPLTYALDPRHSWVQFELLHFGTSTIRGRIGPIQGQVTLNPAQSTGELGLRIATATVSTGIPFFDARIREDDLLGTTTWPEAFFVAQRFRFEGTRLAEVRGEFTLRGVSQPLSLRALSYACRAPGPHESNTDGAVEVCGGDFVAEISRSEFGATFALPFVGDRVRLQLQVEGRRR